MRFSTARRHWATKRPPRRVLLTGPDEFARDLLAIIETKLAPDETIRLYGDASPADLVAALRLRPTQAKSEVRLVVVHEPSSIGHTPAVFDALKALTPVTNVFVVAVSYLHPDAAWRSAFDEHIECFLTTKELLAWTQGRLGGADMDLAENLLDRIGWDAPSAAEHVRTLNLVTERATAEDFDVLVFPPAVDYAEALIRMDRAGALASANRVVDGGWVIEQLRQDLLHLWVLVEARPSPAGEKPIAAARRLDLPVSAVERLLPHMRRYSRASIDRRLEALAVASEAHRAHSRRVWDVLAVLWTSS